MNPPLNIPLIAALFLCLIQIAQAQDNATKPPPTPTLFIIGDSTVKNGSGKGADGLWGWGDPIAAYFDKSKITVANRALGGRSSRSYFAEGLSAKVLDDMKPADFFLMQFGHDDGGSLAQSLAR